jgi:GNAT superfamily N-acetyltransferase
MIQTQVGSLAVASIRPARASDLAALGEFFAGLSVQARYLRFFSPLTPGSALLRLLCGLDGDAVALLATRDGVIIGHGLSADRPGPPGGTAATDIGVVVADAWQGRRIGPTLVGALIAGARIRGATAVTMDVLHGNDRAVRMIKGRWPSASAHRSRDCLTLSIDLADDRRPWSAGVGGGADEVGGALGDHDRRGVGVAGGDGRHDGGVNHPQAFEAVQLELGVDHRELVGAHPAGA